MMDESESAVASAAAVTGPAQYLPPAPQAGSVSPPRADEIRAFRAQFAAQSLKHAQIDRWVHDLGWRFSNGAMKRYLDG